MLNPNSSPDTPFPQFGQFQSFSPGEKPFVLTKANYHSQEANFQYMSNSQYKDFLSCEAMTLAKLSGDWIQEPSDALLIGSYVHSWQEGRQKEFISEHPEMFKKSGELLQKFIDADKMITTLQNDPFVMYVLEGRKELIYTAEMFGCQWKIMIDSHNFEKRRNLDLKTTRSITDKVWSEEDWAKVSFVEKYHYLLQMSIYSEVERIANGRESGDWLNFFIVAVSKEKYPDKAVINMTDPERLIKELAQVEVNMPRILAVKAGLEEPIFCGQCDYCRSTKQLTGAIHYSEL